MRDRGGAASSLGRIHNLRVSLGLILLPLRVDAHAHDSLTSAALHSTYVVLRSHLVPGVAGRHDHRRCRSLGLSLAAFRSTRLTPRCLWQLLTLCRVLCTYSAPVDDISTRAVCRLSILLVPCARCCGIFFDFGAPPHQAARSHVASNGRSGMTALRKANTPCASVSPTSIVPTSILSSPAHTGHADL
jgi:hypothetical protein